MSTEVQNTTSSQHNAKLPVSRRAFVNIYKDRYGNRHISDEDYDSYEAAIDGKDDISTFVETVEIVRQHGG